MKQKVAKDTPLMELTLRRYERPDKMEPRNLIKKFCLSVGLLQPGDSRDIIVDIFRLNVLNLNNAGDLLNKIYDITLFIIISVR